ncbi:MAG: 30S ribosome-binding factor RbfA [Candidatus Omnitrophica bacterium]|nr:30S ribosome-binding factor RbfA [Candidatus Omnitrophota bacterium]MBU1128842.1 30S ribosome-binding factor RbfA [Candidatus Omnitrophota bacterium]MBU1783912.1 30S ribosome-binding factor RbfA [Candidatus Omnitrophota bacterium]MBU1852142.1 30S ribosome-binding factor RbfA [Candidatus Omnitrophota bacterium]
MIDRLSRVAELIRREVALILQTEIDDPEINGVTVIRVAVTSDLSIARIYFALDGDSGDIARVTKALMTHAKFVRGELSRRISLKYMPRISFREDELEKNQRSIDELFKKINTEHRDTDPGAGPEKGEKDEF